jgi:hypothetical protein
MTTTSTAPSTPTATTTVGSHPVAEYSDYADAQRLVDHLSDNGFPVERTRIVGTGIHSVEQVTGRMTTGRAALAGAGSGAWFGLFLGLLFGLFTAAGLFGVILTSVLIGAVWGALFGAVGHWATRGRRDFASVQSLEASHYTVEVMAGYVDQARTLMARR